MANPYKSPDSADAQNGGASVHKASWSARIAIIFLAMATVGFLCAAAMLIPQAIRLTNEAAQLPEQFRNSNDVAVRSSWVLGVSSILLAAVCVSGIVIATRSRTRSAWYILAVAIICFVALAIVFRPV